MRNTMLLLGAATMLAGLFLLTWCKLVYPGLAMISFGLGNSFIGLGVR